MSTYDLKKISQLPAAGTVNNADLVAIVQGGVTKRTTWGVIASVIGTTPGTGGAAAIFDLSVAGSGSILFESGVYLQAFIFTGDDGPVEAGTTNGGTELVDDAIAGKPLVYSLLPDPFHPSGVTVYFEGTFDVKILVWEL